VMTLKKQQKPSILLAYVLGISILSGCTMSEQVYQSETIEQGKWLNQLTTDKAAYDPGEVVRFTLSLTEAVQDGSLLVRYMHLDQLIEEKEYEINGTNEITWEWTPDQDDFKGYMVEVYVKKGKAVIDHENIAVDVSSDWSKFPRYGYLADFYKMDQREQKKIIDKLNRFHINGLQFYDWQYKHERPLKIENGEVAKNWVDIANREVSKETVENYISLAHEKNMKAMNYNLLFGAYENYEEEGVKKEWGLFKDPLLQNQDKHPLPDSWASDIYLMDPSNEAWQDFIINAEKEVFEHLSFDGWHVDQLGDRGPLWNGKGERIDLSTTYVPFLQKAKEELQVDLVMNAVSQYAQGYIAAQAPVNFLYTEVWDAHKTYSSLKDIIDQNTKFSKGKNTVLAAYMNYDLSNSIGQFNTPGVLLTNAVIFAAGGAHLELGENMLSKEYFPHKNLIIPDELHEQLVNYYDFLVAYQNLLRDGAEEITKEITLDGDITVSKRAELGSIWSFAKKKDNKEIIHLINLTDATSLEWRDNEGSQPEPTVKKDLNVTFDTNGKVEKVWLATPDAYNGSVMELDYNQKGGHVTFTLPSLKYWDMVVIEYKEG
jgi:dextranase